MNVCLCVISNTHPVLNNAIAIKTVQTSFPDTSGRSVNFAPLASRGFAADHSDHGTAADVALGTTHAQHGLTEMRRHRHMYARDG